MEGSQESINSKTLILDRSFPPTRLYGTICLSENDIDSVSSALCFLPHESTELTSLSSSKLIRHYKSKSTPLDFNEIPIRNKKGIIISGYHKIRKTAIDGTGHIVDAATLVAKTIADYSYKLITFWDLPEWLRDNKYLHYNHRPQLDTFKQCFRSIFSIHTETGNIWTHIIGLILLIVAMIYIFVRPTVSSDGFPYYPKGVAEILVYMAFFTGGCLCLTFSWLFHTLCCHSQNVSNIFAKLDYSGIAFLICGSCIPAYYYSFYCHQTLKIVYISVSATLAIACIVVSLWNRMSTPTFRPARALVFLSFGLSSIIPVIHNFFIYDTFQQAADVIQFYWLISMGICYVTGCIMYMLLIPERFFPGKISIVFQSHQIFHVLVVVAAFLHLRTLCGMSQYRVSIGRNCSST